MNYNRPDDFLQYSLFDDIEERLESCEKKNSLLKQLVDDKNTEIARLMVALKTIRFAGQNANPTTIWMQKVAAHAMEPNQWPEQPDKPPSITNEDKVDFDV